MSIWQTDRKAISELMKQFCSVFQRRISSSLVLSRAFFAFVKETQLPADAQLGLRHAYARHITPGAEYR